MRLNGKNGTARELHAKLTLCSGIGVTILGNVQRMRRAGDRERERTSTILGYLKNVELHSQFSVKVKDPKGLCHAIIQFVV